MAGPVAHAAGWAYIGALGTGCGAAGMYPPVFGVYGTGGCLMTAGCLAKPGCGA